MDKLTERQKQIWDFIVSTVCEKGRQPTYREVGKHVGVSAQGVMFQLHSLERLGYLRLRGAGYQPDLLAARFAVKK
jgi:SOS-response transcriptional repressor LexA